MDIRRILVDDQFKYIDRKTKRRITDKKTLKRIANMRIPPAYNKIKISKKANDKVQAIGVDEAGRKQYIYNKKFVQEQQEIKFQRFIWLTTLFIITYFLPQKILSIIGECFLLQKEGSLSMRFH